MKNFDLSELKTIIYEGGALLEDYWLKRSKLKILHKEGQGLVSEADKEVEKFLISKLSQLVPEAKVCAEESAFAEDFSKEEISVGLCWMIDPLDGTNNFLSGFDYFSISVGLCMDGIPILGIVYRPLRGDMFIAQKAKGTLYENKKMNEDQAIINQIRNRPSQLRDSLLCTGFAGEKGIKFEQEFEIFKRVMMASRGVRRLGSAALDLCYLAKGFWHGFWEKGLAPWDTAAGSLICKEVGLEVFSLETDKFTPFNKSIVVCSPDIKRELISHLKS